MSALTAWTAVAVCNAVERVCGVRPGIKWPNDVILDGRKLCGILTELELEVDDVTKAVVKTVRKICEKYLDPTRLEEIARKAIEEAGERSVWAENISSFKTKLDAMTKRIDKIYADRLDGLLAEDDFDRLYKKLCDERQRLRDQLREAQSRSEHEGQDAAMARELAQRFIDEAPSREMLLALIDRIELTNDKQIIIKFSFSDMKDQTM